MGDFVNRGSYVRVSEIHHMLHPKPADLLNPSRFFVREGDLNMWNKKKSKKSNRHFFLFNDIMLLCKKQTSKRFFLRVHITLRSPYVSTESIEGSSHSSEFRLHCKTRYFILYAATDDERKEWVKDLNASINGTHLEENGIKGPEESLEIHEEKKERRNTVHSIQQSSPPVTSNKPKRKSHSKPTSNSLTQNNSGTSGAQRSHQRNMEKKRPTDDLNVRPKSMIEGQQLTNNPELFKYNPPTISNNPFLDIPQQNTFATNANPFATNTYVANQRPQSMVVPQANSFNNVNNARPQSMVVTGSPLYTNTPNPFSNPFATNTTINPFTTNTNTTKIQPNPFLTNIPQQSQQQVNPFATTGY